MKLVNDTILDQLLNGIASGTRIVLADDSSTVYANVDSTGDTRVLAWSSLLTTGNYTLADGDVSGRKVTIDSQSSVDVLRTGVPDNYYIIDTGNTRINLITTITSTQQLTTGNKVNIPSVDDEVRDPA